MIGDKGVKLLEDLLKNNGTIKKLYLGKVRENHIETNIIKNDGADFILNGLKGNKVITDFRACIIILKRSL